MEAVMLVYVVIVVALLGAVGDAASCAGLPLWPFPQSCTAGNTTRLRVDPSSFSVLRAGAGAASPHVDALLERFSPFQAADATYKARGPTEPHLGSPPDTTWAEGGGPESPLLERLRVRVRDVGPAFKALDTDESFELVVEAPEATLTANTWFGAQYGLEAFQQVLGKDAASGGWVVQGAPITIRDAPRYAWRGLLVDTANHFLPMSLLLRVVDGMAFNRLNVLHLHVVGSYSFPLFVPAMPWLTEAGAWAPNAVYSPADMSALVEHARTRGVRVVVEVDVPGHAYSWGLGKPELTVACPPVIPDVDIGPVNVVPLDPTKEVVYDTVRGVLDHVTDTFPDAFLHLGGDEIQDVCWSDDPAIARWMVEHNVSDVTALQALFERRLLAMARALGKQSLVWEGTFTKLHSLGVLNASETLIEVWDNATVVDAVAAAGFRVVLADGWYLDRQNPIDGETSWFWEDTWAQMYGQNPTNEAVIGGEANMWGEQVSVLNWEARVWPRACAIAERLWSPSTVQDLASAAWRLSNHRCRMATRGVPTGPIWAGYCGADMHDAYASSHNGNNGSSGIHLTTNQLVMVVGGAVLATVVLLLVLVMCLRGCSARSSPGVFAALDDGERQENLLPGVADT